MYVHVVYHWHTGVENNINPQNVLLLYQIDLKLSVGTVLTSRQIRWSPNFRCTRDNDASGVARVLRAPVQRHVMGPLVEKQLRNFCSYT